MSTSTDEKKFPWLGVALVILCIPVFHYLLVSAGEAQDKATEFMNAQYYPLITKIMQLGAIPYFFVIIIVYSYAKSEEYLAVERRKNRELIKPNLFLRSIFIFVLAFFLFYQIFWVYTYIQHVGENPLLTWSEYINSSNFYKFK